MKGRIIFEKFEDKGMNRNRGVAWLGVVALAGALLIGLLLLPSCEAADESSLNYDCDNLCLKVEECSDDDAAVRIRFYDQFGDVGDCRGGCKKGDNWTVECMLHCNTELTCDGYFDCLEDCLNLND